MTPLFPRLLGDIGGTNARWAYQAQPDAALSHIELQECADFETIDAALDHYLGVHNFPRPRAVALGVATAVAGDAIHFVNNPWSFSIAALKNRLGLARLMVLNDFAALAHSLALLQPADLRRLGGGQAVAGEPVVLIGPGTGLGVAAVVMQSDGRAKVISGEGGHATVAAANEKEAEVLSRLRREFGHVSAERVLSGSGLVNLYRAVSAFHGVPYQDLNPSQITTRAKQGEDAICDEAVALFVSFLAGTASNLALNFGALGGVFIGGGIAPKLGALLNTELFRTRFEDKGRLQSYLAAIPSSLIIAAQPGLLGAAQALNQEALLAHRVSSGK